MTHSPIPKVAAIHDLSCFGRAALTVVIPILSSMGIQVCPLPTAIYSAHGLFSGHYSRDLTETLRQIVRHWKQVGMSFDAIYSGFLNSSPQIKIFSEFILDFCHENQIVVIDPVLGDQGKLYGMIEQDLVERMREYIRLAHIITPNMTEAALLLGEPCYEALSEHTLHEWLKRLSDYGPEVVIITSAVSLEYSHNHIGVIAYDRQEDRFWQIWRERLPQHFPGTGDVFTSVTLGHILQGYPLSKALQRTTRFLEQSMTYSKKCGTPEREGLVLEPLLYQLSRNEEITVNRQLCHSFE